MLKPGYALRLLLLMLFTALALYVVALSGGRQQLPLVVFKLGMVTAAAVAGAWIDWCVFYYDAPDESEYSTQIRRALIMCGCILAVSLGY